MNEEEKKQLVEKIHFDIAKLTQSIELSKDSLKPVVPDVAIGRLTRMEAIGSQNISKATVAGMKSTLASLHSALRRIDHEDFGLCIQCENEIKLARLQLLPGSTQCVNCAV